MGHKRGNGEGSISQRRDGTWEARLTLPDGKRKSFYNKSRQVVARRLAGALRDREKGLAIITDERLTVGSWLAQWLENMTPPRLRASTHIRYGYALAHVTRAYGDLRLTRLTAAHLKSLYQTLQRPKSAGGAGLSQTSAHHVHTVLHEALDDAVKLDLLVINPTERVDAPKLRRAPVEPFTAEEVARLLDSARGDRLEALWTVALTTGARQGELLALTWRSIVLDEAQGQMRIAASLAFQGRQDGRSVWKSGPPKTASSKRQIALAPITVETLRAHRKRQLAERLAAGEKWQDRELVFCDEQGGYLNPQSLTRYAWRDALARAGLPYKRFHDCRHGAASFLLAAGVPLKVVSVMLGHTTITITGDTYSHVTPDLTRDAADAMEAFFRQKVGC